jgi:dTDP-glucose 4,6-dehydratase
MKTLLIIGGTGFFGKSILDSFKRDLLGGYNITKIIVLARNIEKFISQYPELVCDNFEFINGDISTISILPYADYVIHAATSTNMNDYINGNENNSRENIENAVTNYCKIASNFHLGSKIIYCSSGAVYGKQPLDIEKIHEDFEFDQILKDLPKDKKAYCLGKRFAENEIINLGKIGFNVSIARCFAFSGKYLPKDQHYAYGNFIGQAERGETVTVKTNGIVYRSYMEADDLVISLFKILSISSPICPIYNIGSENEISLYDLAKIIANKYNVSYKFENYNDEIIIDRYVPSISKLKSL